MHARAYLWCCLRRLIGRPAGRCRRRWRRIPSSPLLHTVSQAQGKSNSCCDNCSHNRQIKDQHVSKPASCLRRSNHSEMAPLTTAMVRWPRMNLRRPQTTAQAPTRMRPSLPVPWPPPRHLSWQPWIQGRTPASLPAPAPVQPLSSPALRSAETYARQNMHQCHASVCPSSRTAMARRARV